MRSKRRRAWLLVGLGLLSVPLVATALAYACTGLATVSVSPGSAASGATVTVTGKYFTAHDPSDERSDLAKIRVDDVNGPVLATAAPAGPAREFSVRVRLPQLSPGTHVLIVTQNNRNGTPSYGTPARTDFTVTAPPPANRGASGGAARQIPAVTGTEPVFLTLAKARAIARKRVKSGNRRARSIRARCSRRSDTTAVCRTRWRVGKRSFSKRLVVTLSQSSRFGW